VPTYSPTQIVTRIKSITAREIFKKNPKVKKQLWGGNIWTTGFFVNTVSKYGGEKVIANYVKNQGKQPEYKKLHTQEATEQDFLF
jgi:putative transposase